MISYKKDFEGPMARYWEQYLLDEDRDIETQFIQKFLKKGLVLDVGCGPGKQSAYFSKNQEVIGLDLSPDLLTIAKKECKKNGKYENVNLIRGDMRYFPFKPGVFDNVVHILAFGYFSDAENESVFTEIVRVLKKGGIYIYQNYHHPKSLRPLEWKTIRPKTPKGFSKTQTIKYDPETKMLHVKETIENKHSGNKIDRDYERRLYSLDELEELHEKNGLEINTVFGPILMKEFGELAIGEFDEKKEGNITVVSEKI